MKFFRGVIRYLMSNLKFILPLLTVILLLPSCEFLNKSESYNNGFKAGYLEGLKDGKEQAVKVEKPVIKETLDSGYQHGTNDNLPVIVTNPAIPEKAVLVLNFIRQYKKPPENYVGGRKFGNYEHHLPERDAAGNKIEYQEWDIHPKIEGRNRGSQRLVTGSDGRAWYTPDHYNSFIEIE